MNGPNKELENKPEQIDLAIKEYQAEIDLWVVDGKYHLGHDNPQYLIDREWLVERCDKLWIHCKNVEAITKLSYDLSANYNYFWHEEDTLTLTSHGYIWVYPGKQPITSSIAVMPELYNDDVSRAMGICTDYVIDYANGSRK